jgi:hypothetical protein
MPTENLPTVPYPGPVVSLRRTLWSIGLIRAQEIRDADVIKVDGQWRWVFDAWTAGDDPASVFGGDSETARMLNERCCDWSSNIWVGVRYLNAATSTPDEVDDAWAFLPADDLVEVQVPTAIQAAPTTQED